MQANLFGASLLGLLLATAAAHAEAPRVVASIAPIHSLVAAVMQGVGTPELLIPAEVSEHDYALKPSDLRKIANADLVIWIGESLETYLVKPLETEGVADLALIEAEGIEPHAYEDAHEEHEDEAEEDEHGHDHLGLDPHVWLDPVRTVAIVNAVAERLSEIDRENADLYAANAGLAVAALRALNSELSARLAPLGNKPFVTFHDGYSYFVERYGLNQVGQLTVHPEQRPGAATLGELRATIAEEQVACVFAEPQFDPGAIRSLAGDAAMRVGVLDALGAGLEPGPTLYGALLRKNAAAVAACLAPTS
jgi:zinc transport system substrate-binding protein